MDVTLFSFNVSIYLLIFKLFNEFSPLRRMHKKILSSFRMLKKCIQTSAFLSLNVTSIDLKFFIKYSQRIFPGRSFGRISKFSIRWSLKGCKHWHFLAWHNSYEQNQKCRRGRHTLRNYWWKFPPFFFQWINFINFVRIFCSHLVFLSNIFFFFF